MAKRLLAYPPDAEAEIEQLRERLTQANIEFYETPGSRWGFSHPTIWIRDENDLPQAKQVLLEHAQQYAAQARVEYQQTTGYNPDATGAEQARFLLRFWWRRKLLLIAVLIGFFLVAWYLSLFFSLFK